MNYSVAVNREVQHMLNSMVVSKETSEVGVITSTGQHYVLGKDPSFIQGMTTTYEIAEGVISDRYKLMDQLLCNIDLYEEEDLLQELDQYL
jgi:hypothetical protein